MLIILIIGLIIIIIIIVIIIIIRGGLPIRARWARPTLKIYSKLFCYKILQKFVNFIYLI